MKKCYLMLGVIIMLVIGCSSMKKLFRAEVSGLVKDPSFSYQAVVKEKMAVGGVVSLVSQLNNSQRNNYANVLRAHFVDERKTFQVAPVFSVIKALGQEEYSQMLSDYKDSGGIDDIWLNKLSGKIKARYVIFTSIQSDDIENTREKEKEDKYEDNKDKKKDKKKKKVFSRSIRSVSATMNIYDLQQKYIVWSGTVTQKKTRETEYEEQKDDAIIGIIKAATKTQTSDDDLYLYPQPPRSNEVVAMVFRGFAENMPEQKD
ncbi:hypothetical protein QUF80_07010 [Desulfococcaceae bacterium HSG8]|nr:hypothetical protein [Desulfococcaceae bacterium HSG8]